MLEYRRIISTRTICVFPTSVTFYLAIASWASWNPFLIYSQSLLILSFSVFYQDGSIVGTLVVCCLEVSAFIIGRSARYRVNFVMVYISYPRECQGSILIVVWKCFSWHVAMPIFAHGYIVFPFIELLLPRHVRVFVSRMEETVFRQWRWLRIYWIRSYVHPTKGDPPVWCLEERLISSHPKMSTCFEILKRPSTWSHPLGRPKWWQMENVKYTSRLVVYIVYVK